MAETGLLRNIVGAAFQLFLAVVLLASAAIPSNAQEDIENLGTPGLYDVTIFQFALCSDLNCSSRMVLAKGSESFDLAAVSSGGAAGDFGSGTVTVRPGVYTHVRMEVGRRIGTSGRVAFDIGGIKRDCVTNSDGNLDDFGTPFGTLVERGQGAPSPSYEIITATDSNELKGDSFVVRFEGDRFTIVKELSSPITIVSAADLPATQLNFDVANKLFAQIHDHTGRFDDPDNWVCIIGTDAPGITVIVGDQKSKLRLAGDE